MIPKALKSKWKMWNCLSASFSLGEKSKGWWFVVLMHLLSAYCQQGLQWLWVVCSWCTSLGVLPQPMKTAYSRTTLYRTISTQSHSDPVTSSQLYFITKTEQTNTVKRVSEEWVNKCQWGWQSRTVLEKCAHLYDETQGTIKHKCFQQRVFVGCNDIENNKSRWK